MAEMTLKKKRPKTLDLKTVRLPQPGGCRPFSDWYGVFFPAAAGTRDEATNARFDDLEDTYRLFRCHTIMNCVEGCPKGLRPTKTIGKIKEMMLRRVI